MHLFFKTATDSTPKTNSSISGNDPGLCGPLTNLYTSHQLDPSVPNICTDSPKTVYRRAIDERQHQDELRRNKEDFVNSSFVDNGVDYSVAVKPASPTISKQGLDEITNKEGQHSILTFATDQQHEGQTVFHQVALGRNNSAAPSAASRCYFFDANLPDFERKGPCEEISALAASIIKQEIDPNAEEVLVASDKKFTSPQ